MSATRKGSAERIRPAAVREAVQAAALAANYELAAELAHRHRPTVCLHCGSVGGQRKRIRVRKETEYDTLKYVGWVHASCASKVLQRVKGARRV